MLLFCCWSSFICCWNWLYLGNPIYFGFEQFIRLCRQGFCSRGAIAYWWGGGYVANIRICTRSRWISPTIRDRSKETTEGGLSGWTRRPGCTGRSRCNMLPGRGRSPLRSRWEGMRVFFVNGRTFPAPTLSQGSHGQRSRAFSSHPMHRTEGQGEERRKTMSPHPPTIRRVSGGNSGRGSF